MRLVQRAESHVSYRACNNAFSYTQIGADGPHGTLSCIASNYLKKKFAIVTEKPSARVVSEKTECKVLLHDLAPSVRLTNDARLRKSKRCAHPQNAIAARRKKCSQRLSERIIHKQDPRHVLYVLQIPFVRGCADKNAFDRLPTKDT